MNNELYVGRMVWNRLRYVKNPDTGKPISRLNPKADWIAKETPALRIVNDELWPQRGTSEGDASNYHPRREHRLCETTSVPRLGPFEEKLLKQELFEEFCEEFTREMNRLRGEHRANPVAGVRELSRLDARRRSLVESIMEGVPGSEVKDELIAIAARREELQRQHSPSLSSDDSALHIPQVSLCICKECSRLQKTKLAAYTEAFDDLSGIREIGSISGSRALCKFEECRPMLYGNGLHDLESVGGQRTFTVVILHGETELGIFDMKPNPWSWIPVDGSHEQDLTP